MVGVAGRSKGCATCRKRKVKCDLARPLCERCKRSRLTCLGYDRYPVFIVQTAAGTQKRQHLDEVKPRTDTSLQVTRRRTLPEAPNDESSRRTAAIIGLDLQAVATLSSIPDGAAHKSLALSWFYQSFTHSAGMPSLSAFQRPSHWLYYVMQSSNHNALLDRTLLGVSVTRCGTLMSDDAMLAQGREYYTQALRLLQRTLSNAEAAAQDETLASAALMVLYELLDGLSASRKSANGWHQHLAGLERLLQHRGPLKCQSRLGKAVLEHSRHILMLRNMFLRTPSVLSQRDWLRIPWDASEKTADQRLFDGGLLLAGVFERADALDKSQDNVQIANLIDECLKIEQGVRQVTLEYSRSPSDGDCIAWWYGVGDSWTDTSAQLLLSTTALGIQLGACNTACDLYGRLNTPQETAIVQQRRDPLQAIISRQKQLARELLRQVSMYLAMNVGAIGPARLVFALQHAKRQFGPEDPELNDCERILNMLDGGAWQLGSLIVPSPHSGWWKESTVVSI